MLRATPQMQTLNWFSIMDFVFISYPNFLKNFLSFNLKSNFNGLTSSSHFKFDGLNRRFHKLFHICLLAQIKKVLNTNPNSQIVQTQNNLRNISLPRLFKNIYF